MHLGAQLAVWPGALEEPERHRRRRQARAPSRTITNVLVPLKGTQG